MLACIQPNTVDEKLLLIVGPKENMHHFVDLTVKPDACVLSAGFASRSQTSDKQSAGAGGRKEPV